VIRIIVDSTCDLPDEVIKKYDIKILPLRVNINGADYADKVTINVDEVYDAMKKGIYPKTSQPNLMDMHKLLLKYASKGDSIIFLSFSSKMSCTYQAVSSTIEELREEFPGVDMEVVDTKGGSTGSGLIALQASKLAAAGKNFKTIVKQTRQLAEHIEHIFTITDLNWLVRGGRISRSSGFIGDVLNIKPILHVNNGIIEVLKKVRGKRNALNQVVEIVSERIKKFPDQIIGISHADDYETALELERMLKEKFKDAKFMVNKIGSVLGTHLGIGGVGVFFLNEKTDLYIY
jgi:DegV family protein with EDD domain